MKTVLYLGTDPSHFISAEKVVHLPLIEIAPRAATSLEIRKALSDLPEYTHILFTSKNAVRVFFEHLEALSYSLETFKTACIIAVGKTTRRALETRGVEVLFTAEEECQEGLIKLMRPLDLDDAYVFLPCSSLSRPLLAHFLEGRGIRHQICFTYDTVLVRPETLPNLEEVDDIIFTSPSTVAAFFQCFCHIPQGKRLGVLGPITEKALKIQLTEEREVYYV